MNKDKEELALQDLIADLKAIKSEVSQILDEVNEKTLSRAAKHYPRKLNQLLTERNIKSVSGIFPIVDLAFIENRKTDIDLLDLNSKKNDIDLLRDVIQRIDRELVELI